MGNVLGGCRKAVSYGVDLEEASKAFGGSFPIIRVSTVQADMPPLSAGVQDCAQETSHRLEPGDVSSHIGLHVAALQR
jgi:hypothetical protein